MAFGMIVFRGHMIGPSNEKHPETGKALYAISELKPALTPPLLTTQSECKDYIRKVEPFDRKNLINPYGKRIGNFRKPVAPRKDRRIERSLAYFTQKYSDCET